MWRIIALMLAALLIILDKFYMARQTMGCRVNLFSPTWKWVVGAYSDQRHTSNTPKQWFWGLINNRYTRGLTPPGWDTIPSFAEKIWWLPSAFVNMFAHFFSFIKLSKNPNYDDMFFTASHLGKYSKKNVYKAVG